MSPSLGSVLDALSSLCSWNCGNDFPLFRLSLSLLQGLKLQHRVAGPAAGFPQQLESSATTTPAAILACYGSVDVGVKTQPPITPDGGLRSPPDVGNVVGKSGGMLGLS